MGEQTDPNLLIYVNCMAEVRQRIGAIKWAVMSVELIEKETFVFAELIFVQFRKILELIAFASLTANKDSYAVADEHYALHWRAKDIMRTVERVNPDYYPVPAQITAHADRGKYLVSPLPPGEWLTKDDFEYLYDSCGDALHARNPFSGKDRTIQLKYKVTDWVLRIQKLLAVHDVSPVGTPAKWIVQVPSTGNVQVLGVAPTPPAGA